MQKWVWVGNGPTTFFWGERTEPTTIGRHDLKSDANQASEARFSASSNKAHMKRSANISSIAASLLARVQNTLLDHGAYLEHAFNREILETCTPTCVLFPSMSSMPTKIILYLRAQLVFRNELPSHQFRTCPSPTGSDGSINVSHMQIAPSSANTNTTAQK